MMSLLASTVLTAAMTTGCGGCAQYSAPACQVAPAMPAGHVMPAAPAAAPAATARATTGYRSYSYQPGTVAPAPVYRSNTSSRPFYSYPKTDPRRYQHN